MITGPKEGKVHTEYDFTFTSTDPLNLDLSYFVEWGDGATTGWSTPQEAGTSFLASHAWTMEGAATIKAKAKNLLGFESKWSTYTFIVPRNRASSYLWYQWVLDRYPLLEVIISWILSL